MKRHIGLKRSSFISNHPCLHPQWLFSPLHSEAKYGSFLVIEERTPPIPPTCGREDCRLRMICLWRHTPISLRLTRRCRLLRRLHRRHCHLGQIAAARTRPNEPNFRRHNGRSAPPPAPTLLTRIPKMITLL